MEECENLCDRLTIMAAGVMRCIGTTQHLKKQYAQGFSALIKIRDTHESDGELSQLKSDVMNVFSEMFCVLKDEHKVIVCLALIAPLINEYVFHRIFSFHRVYYTTK